MVQLSPPLLDETEGQEGLELRKGSGEISFHEKRPFLWKMFCKLFTMIILPLLLPEVRRDHFCIFKVNLVEFLDLTSAKVLGYTKTVASSSFALILGYLKLPAIHPITTYVFLPHYAPVALLQMRVSLLELCKDLSIFSDSGCQFALQAHFSNRSKKVIDFQGFMVFYCLFILRSKMLSSKLKQKLICYAIDRNKNNYSDQS